MNFQAGTSASIANVNYCQWCYGIGKSRCGRCHNVYYCSKDHQMQHWAIHKTTCGKDFVSETPQAASLPPVDDGSFLSFDTWCHNNIQQENNPLYNAMNCESSTYNETLLNETEDKIDFAMPSDEEILSSLNNELLVPNDFWDVTEVTESQDTAFHTNMVENSLPQNFTANSKLVTQHNEFHQISGSCEESKISNLRDISANIVHDLNTYGICVIDKFVGLKFGNLICEEVQNIYSRGIFQKGELVQKSAFVSEESVRSDVITWVDGTEPYCSNIGYLIRTLDAVVKTCNKMRDNGILSRYKLHRRTKAMIACYPGDGTYYKKHIDNPNGDGRCVTCIYYLNKDWDTKVHGGLLRMFPSVHENQVANIEPVFDRMLFFWSDKRNPHEVLPAYATRFAITVWYFDADERDQAILRSKTHHYN